MADDDGVSVWHLRETQALLDYLSHDGWKTALIDSETFAAWLKPEDGQDKSGAWWDLLREAVAQYGLETGAQELLAAHFTEWLAEWGREVRRQQRGLLLSTAHRPKGLEFDHVAVLDGGWESGDDNADPDAPRRLMYVAMTRARQNLLLARKEYVKGGHALN